MTRLRRQLWLLAFFDEFVPLYALFALWFEDNGISTVQISLVFALWSGVALVLEIPSGALADRMDRRHVIAIAYLLRMAAIATWIVWPTLLGVALGAVLWAVHDALASGAWEAMIYDELARGSDAESYSSVMARLAQAAWIAVAAAAVAAWLLEPAVGVSGVGWTSVGVLIVAFVLVLRLPGAPPVEVGEEDTTFSEWWATLRQGVREARTIPVLGRLVVLGSLIETMTLFEEYIPFLARRAGADNRTVPIILGLAWLGFVVGAEIAARRPRLAARVQASLMALGVLTAIVAIQGRGSPFLVVALVFLHLAAQSTFVLADARLQERANDETRATVGSVRGFLTGILGLATFGMMAALDRSGDVRPGLFVLLIPAALSVVLIHRWMPPPLSTTPALLPRSR